MITSLWAEPEEGDESGNETLDSAIEHIAEAQSTEALIVAPATANTLAKFAHGIADDFLSTMYLATKAPVVLAPAMNVNMWEHPATQANVAALEARGAVIVPPGSGYLACGMTGSGRLADTAVLVEAVLRALGLADGLGNKDLLGETCSLRLGGRARRSIRCGFWGTGRAGRWDMRLRRLPPGAGRR